MSTRKEESSNIIRKYVLLGIGGGLIKNPVISTASSIGFQMMMIKELCKLYNVEFDKRLTNVLISSVLGSVAVQLLSVMVSKAISGDNATHGVDFSNAAFSSIYMATVGEFYETHFQRGGTLADADAKDIASYFLDEIKRKEIGMADLTDPFGTISRNVLG